MSRYDATPLMTVKEFYDELERHDWYYHFSDDGSVFQRGSVDHNRLERIANTSQEHRKLYDGFRKHYFTGEPWGNEKQPLPPKPEGE